VVFLYVYYSLVMSRPDAVLLLDLEELFYGLDDIEDCDVSAGLCQAFCEGETAATGAAGDEGRSSLERELDGSAYMFCWSGEYLGLL